MGGAVRLRVARKVWTIVTDEARPDDQYRYKMPTIDEADRVTHRRVARAYRNKFSQVSEAITVPWRPSLEDIGP